MTHICNGCDDNDIIFDSGKKINLTNQEWEDLEENGELIGELREDICILKNELSDSILYYDDLKYLYDDLDSNLKKSDKFIDYLMDKYNIPKEELDNM